MLARIGVDRLVRSAVDGEVGLPVAVDVQTAYRHSRVHRALEDARQHLSALPFDLARQPTLTDTTRIDESPCGCGPGRMSLSTGSWAAFRRLRWASCFARFPQIAMLPHRRARPRCDPRTEGCRSSPRRPSRTRNLRCTGISRVPRRSAAAGTPGCAAWSSLQPQDGHPFRG